MTITTVNIPANDLKVFAGQPVLIGVYVLDKLKAAGVPVTGSLWPTGVADGEMRIAMSNGNMNYEWETEDEQLF